MDAVLAGLVKDKPVVIFSKSTCCMSHTVKSLILSYGANLTVYELDQIPNSNQVERALVQLGRREVVPTVFIGQKYVGGPNELMSHQVRGTLVPLLREARAIWI
ncbi:monothiol glutaredoxin-S1 [Syzygium oleosum]|uniref:monothiol glutaredoxin-S1 n=1 Tax=Syzygium oleosum TaxID=219896 RepID=UPI0011D1E6CB|nr:monothiol glutaredoxin-S1 [Syzygium oleosum]